MSKEFKDGYEYANQQLKLGVTPKELEIQIDDSFDFNDFVSGMIARWREQEQEPVAWCQLVDGKVQDLLTSFEMKDWLYDKSWTALYTAPPKRESLSNEEVIVKYKDIALDNPLYVPSYYAGFRDAERAHGIGGE